MQRASSTTNVTSLLQMPMQSAQRPASFHERELDHGGADMSMLRPLGGVHEMHQQETKDLPRPYKCPMCEKAFHRLEHQTRHIRTHTGEKPHACTFQGCTKKFSRSDELTRHSRIHMNPNGRRGHKSASSLHRTNMVDNHHTSNLMPPPNAKIIPKSAPTSTIGSPNVSPPNNYLAPLGGYRSHPGSSYDFSILARTATQQLERERNPTYGSSSLNAYSYQQKRAAPYPTGLSSQPMSRSHSYERDSEDPYSAHRAVKRSRPGSPVSTAPSSPTFSHDSCSPTPEHTPLATPHHSPRLYPRDYPMANNDYQLPSIRNLTLAPPAVRVSGHQEPNHGPRLPPMEIADPFFNSQNGNTNTPPNGPSGLSHIFARPDAFGRKLPPPIPNVRSGPLVIGSSASSSAANSIAGGDLADRL